MLDTIVAAVEARLPAVVARYDEYRSAVTVTDGSFAGALSGPGVSIIAEVKRRSPSRGTLNADLDPAGQAALYEQGGAAAISVLTERDHFGGSPDDLRLVRSVVGVPVLRKDFIIHPAQVWESAAMGADAILLIVAILDDALLLSLLTEATGAGLPALVEVHSAEEVARAQDAGAQIIGVNNRNLRTFEVDLTTSEQLAPLLGAGVLRVAESGIHSPEDVARMGSAGYNAVLVGESLVRAEDPSDLVERFVAAGA